MNIFDSLQKYAGNWSVVGSRSFTEEEITAVESASVVDSQFGHSVCFFLHGGGQSYIPLSRDSELATGDSIDLSKAKLLTLHRDGNDDIVRIQA